jgi:hypothetical protein
MNTWYTYHGLQLDLLDYFDYWLKIDYDVVWSEDMTHDLRKLFFDARTRAGNVQIVFPFQEPGCLW